MQQRFNVLVEVSIAVLAILSVVLLSIEYLVELTPAQVSIVYQADLAICVMFAVEFIYRIVRSDNKSGFIKGHGYEVLAMVPAYIFVIFEVQPIFGGILRSLRLIRVVRLLVVIARLRRTMHVAPQIVQRNYLIYLLMVSLFIVFVGGLGAYMMESGSPDAVIKTPGDAIWWSLATVTTVGYGDIVPQTLGGRIVGVAIMFVGISFLGVFISTLGAAFTERRLREARRMKGLQDSVVDSIKQKLDQLESLPADEVVLLMTLVESICKSKLNKSQA